jgi:hypothetical protein
MTTAATDSGTAVDLALARHGVVEAVADEVSATMNEATAAAAAAAASAATVAAGLVAAVVVGVAVMADAVVVVVVVAAVGSVVATPMHPPIARIVPVGRKPPGTWRTAKGAWSTSEPVPRRRAISATRALGAQRERMDSDRAGAAEFFWLLACS